MATSEIPQENVFEGLYTIELQGSAQLQTVLAVCNQELNRDRVSPSIQRSRTMVRQHVEHVTRTRNSKAWNERVETGVLVKSYKGRKVSVERKSRRILSVESNWTVSTRRLLQFQPRVQSWFKKSTIIFFYSESADTD